MQNLGAVVLDNKDFRNKKGLKERTVELIKVADPSHRDWLEQCVKERFG